MSDCGHKLCVECFEGYCSFKVSIGPEVIFSKCPDMKCKNLVPERVFKQVLKPVQFEKYRNYIIKSFVNLSKTIKWCPGKACKFIVEQKYGDIVEIDCECGLLFCFGCLKPAHAPISCELIQTWLDRLAETEGKDTEDYLKNNTKKCPNCKTLVAKISGCNHMTCNNCRHGFCWLCMGSDHYACGTFE